MKYLLNRLIVHEILLWSKNTGENPLVFDPIAKACKLLGPACFPNNETRANELSAIFEKWCSSQHFIDLLQSANDRSGSVSVDAARVSLSAVSGSESFVATLPVDNVLGAFGALVRADLRARDSRSSVRIDELFIWQGFYRRFDLHDLSLLLLAACASSNVLVTFDKLLAIKSQPGSLIQLSDSDFNKQSSPQFVAAMRMFALRNFEAAQTGIERSLQKDPDSPTFIFALSLAQIMQRNLDLAEKTLASAERFGPSSVLKCIRYLQTVLQGSPGDLPEDEDPVSFFVTSYAYLSKRDHEKFLEIGRKHLERFPQDLLAYFTMAQCLTMRSQEDFYDDPPLPGSGVVAELGSISAAEANLHQARSIIEEQGLSSLLEICVSNLSMLSLLRRDFQVCAKTAEEAIQINPTAAEAKLNQSIAYVALGDLPSAMRSLQGLPLEYSRFSGRLAAESYFHAGAFEDALQVWNRLQEQETERLWRLRILCRMLETYRLQQDSKNGQRCVDIMLANFQHEPETLFAIAFELWQLGRFDDAVDALKRAKEFAAPNLKKWISWELGRILFDRGQVLGATDEYNSISNEEIDSTQAREFAVALFQAGLKPAAYKWAKRLREIHGDVIPGITEIETDYLVSETHLDEATDLLQKLAKTRPLSVMNRLAIAKLCVSLGQEEKAYAELAEIKDLAISKEMSDEVERMLTELEIVISLKAKDLENKKS